MAELLLRFLADNSSYYDFLKGLNNLTVEQQQVLFERLKSELSKNKTTQPCNNCDEIVTNKSPVSIRPRALAEDKPHTTIECCLHCGSTRIKKIGKTKAGMQRYLCKDCKKSFSENYGLITHYTHLKEWQWLEAVRGTVIGQSTTEIAKNMNVTPKTAWLCRMKIYSTLQNIFSQQDTFNSIVEADGKYERISFKGLRNKSFFIDTLGRLPRHHRAKADKIKYLGEDYKRLFISNPTLLKEMIYSSQNRFVGRNTIGTNHQHLCILTAIDRSNNIFIKPVTSGTPKSNDVYTELSTVISHEAVLITDDHNSYKYLCRKLHIEHVIVDSKKHNYGTYNLGRVNSLHSALDTFFVSRAYMPATKYIDLYLYMFWWLQKNHDLSSNEQINRLFAIMTGQVSMETRALMSKVTYNQLNHRPLPIDTKGYF